MNIFFLCLYFGKNNFDVTNFKIIISFFQYHSLKTTATAESVFPRDFIEIIF